jgi:hypothetical protein
MFRTPLPGGRTDRLEQLKPDQILTIFASCLQRGYRRDLHSDFAAAWGNLFSTLYLSADDLVTGMQAGEHPLGEAGERILREFIKTDCAAGGFFILDVISKGGNIDRAALIMIADMNDIASVEHNGTTALHLLADACDKRVRPVMIERAGKRLLSSVYDRRDLPVLFLIFGLTDLCGDDLDAIAKIFSRDDLRMVMSRNRTGRNALVVFMEAAGKLKRYAPLERHAFEATRAIRDAQPENSSGVRVSPRGKERRLPGKSLHSPDGNTAEVESDDK